jgi:hypothetical protein
MLERVCISSNRMKMLKFLWYEKLVEVKIDTPNLHGLVYYGGVFSFSSNAMTLSETNLFLKGGTL